jgi:hypothetical protein
LSYVTKKTQSQRQAFTLIEIDVDINDPALDAEFAQDPNSYGTPRTTDDIRAYTGVDFRTYRFSDQQLFGIDHFTGLDSVNTTTPKVEPGKSIGFRASASIKLQDFIDNDVFSLPPPYDDRRTTGAFWPKFIARNYLKNRKCRVIRGYDPFNFDLANCQVENYIIDEEPRIDIKGNVTLKLVDPLKLTNGVNAKAPAVSQGVLASDLNDSATTLDYTSTVADEYGAVGATGVIALSKEVMTYEVLTAGTSGQLQVVRGAFKSEQQTHDAGDTIQKCLFYDDTNIMDIFDDLIRNNTEIDNAYITTTKWNALKTGELANFNLTNIITKPTEVKKLLNQLIQISGASMYFDVITETIEVVPTPNFDSPVISYNETSHIEQDSISVKPADDKLITRQIIYWDKRNPTEGDDENNFAKRFAVIDASVEAGANIGVQSSGDDIKSSWLVNDVEDNQIATSIVQRNVQRFNSIPREIEFTVDSRWVGELENGNRMWLGSVFEVAVTNEVNPDGTKRTVTAQCVEIKRDRDDDKWKIKGLTYNANVAANVDYYVEGEKLDYILADDPDFAPILTAGGAREYVVVITNSATIGSTSVSNASFRQGTFPSGATLKLTHQGKVLGKGGKGGKGGDISNVGGCQAGSGFDGQDGGDAFEFTTDVVLDNLLGLIGAGGGGGAGSDAQCFTDTSGEAGSGGGGGQGFQGGAGGAAGAALDPQYTEGVSGQSGTRNYAGDGGTSNAGDGGTLGQDGQSAFVGISQGGSAGRAILTNGNTVTITAGDNAEQIKGDIV